MKQRKLGSGNSKSDKNSQKVGLSVFGMVFTLIGVVFGASAQQSPSPIISGEEVTREQSPSSPFIETISPREVEPQKAPVTLTIRGKGFTEHSRVRLFYSQKDILEMDLQPVEVRSDYIAVNVGAKWFQLLAKAPNLPTSFHGLRIPASTFAVKVLNPDGQE
jgi:hypothetical protein